MSDTTRLDMDAYARGELTGNYIEDVNALWKLLASERARAERLAGALKPFADAYSAYKDTLRPDIIAWIYYHCDEELTEANYEAARKALDGDGGA